MINYINQILNDTLKLVAIDSVQSEPTALSPFGDGVGKCLKEALNIAEGLGFKTHFENGYYGTATIGEGEEFGILGHVDVVPYKNQTWTKKPLGEIKDGVIYGRGVLDDKGPMLCCLYAVYKLIQDGYTPKKTIKFIFGGNEESGWECIKRYNELEKMPRTGFSPDADFPVINCEKGIAHFKISIDKPEELISLVGGERANMVIDKVQCQIKADLPKTMDVNLCLSSKNGITDITAYGTAAHGSTPELGDNAFLHVIKFLADNLGGIYEKLNALLYSIKGEGVGLNISDEQSGALSFNVGVVKTVLDKLDITIDIRYPSTYKLDFIVNKMNEAFGFAKVDLISDQAPLFVDKNDPLVQTLLKAYNDAMGTKCEPIAIGGGTYARAMEHGVGFGPVFPGDRSCAHEADEYFPISAFEKAFEIYYNAIKELCF